MKHIQTEGHFTTILFLVLMVSGMFLAAGDALSKNAGDAEQGHRLLLELKREATNRGTPEETTKTQIKIDALLDRTVSLLRLEVPFPDDKTSFEGDPLSPRLGDIKVRVGFRPVPLNDIPLGFFLESTFPTADSEELGSGKYQVAMGIRTNFPISLSQSSPNAHRVSFEPLIKQVVSVAGDEGRKDINYMKFELSLKDTWKKKYWLKLTPKPVVNWEQSAETGAVAELQGGWIINSRWKVWLLLGSRLWGEKVPSTYDQRVGFNVSVFF